ncbi:MAG: prepilin peptidase [Patescibacteria group bacterium]
MMITFDLLLFATTFIFGTAIGSFLNVWSRRLLRGKPPTGRSRCEHCKHVLGFFDLIPLISFAALRGKCRYCKKPLSWQYPIVELGTGLLFAAIALTTNYSLLTTIPLLIAASALIVILVTDFSDQVIFDQVIWVALGGAIGYRLLAQFMIYDLLGALGVYLFLQTVRILTKKRGMGEGDPPLGFVAALLVGWPAVLVELFLAFTIGGAVGAGLVLAGKNRLKDRIAFGPFIVVATFATLFFGERILSWYLGVMGI